MTNARAPQFDLSGRVALVTGASSGFGAHFARILAASGAKVVIAARRAERIAALARDITDAGGEALAVPMDVTDEASVIAAYDAAQARFGTVSSIIANAGTEAAARSTDVSIADFDQVLATNVRGAFLTIREGAKRLVADGSREKGHGRAVVIGSITAHAAYPNMAAYAASKAGVEQMARSMALEWARLGININVIAPGYIATEMTQPLMESESGKALLASFPRKRLAQMDDLSVPLLWLASDSSSGVTGSVFTVDDGQTL